MLKRIKHTNLLVHNYDEAANFYEQKFGEIQHYGTNGFLIAKDLCGNKLFVSDSKFFY